MPGNRGGIATLRDVAIVAAVDRSTVSRVVNNDPGLRIRPETRARIMQAIRQVGYVPNIAARSLRTAMSHTIGLVLPDYANPVYAEIIRGAEVAARDNGHVLLTGSVGRQSNQVDAFLSTLGRGRVDRLIIAGIYLTRGTIGTLNNFGAPWLLMNSQQADVVRTIALDDRRAASLAVSHLFSLGHRRIAHLRGAARSDTARRREIGYRDALKANDIPFDAALTVEANYTAQGGRTAMEGLLASGIEFTAIFAANLASALGAIREASRQGVSIPGDLSVVGVHDLDLADYLLPPLTTVRMPLFELGRQGVDLVLQDTPTRVSEVIREPIELIWRGSTGPVVSGRSTTPIGPTAKEDAR